MTLPVERGAVSPGTQRPEGGGRPRQVQADVPEGVNGGGDATGEGEVGRDTRCFRASSLSVNAGGQSSSQAGGGRRVEVLARHHRRAASLWPSWQCGSLDWEMKMMLALGAVQRRRAAAAQRQQAVCVCVCFSNLGTPG